MRFENIMNNILFFLRAFVLFNILFFVFLFFNPQFMVYYYIVNSVLVLAMLWYYYVNLFLESRKVSSASFMSSFSVVVPVFNESPKLLFKTLESVLRQDVFVPFEVIVVDDGSVVSCKPVCVGVCLCVCVSVCEMEKKRERERVCMCVAEREREQVS